MPSNKGKYQPMPASAPPFVDDPSRSYKEKHDATVKSLRPDRVLGILLALSLLANAALGMTLHIGSGSTGSTGSSCGNEIDERSEFASLARTVPQQWQLNYDVSETDWNETWENTNYNPGVLALDDAYAMSMRLPRAQRWPWDSKKGIYLINAYHTLHCVKSIKKTLDEFYSGIPQSITLEHVRHCLLVLRDEIRCNADDTPRYSGYQPPRSSGLGQVRMCRDWDALEAWATDKERSGCWRVIPGDEDVEGFTYLDRYRYCPEGSRYKEKAETAWLNETVSEAIKRID